MKQPSIDALQFQVVKTDPAAKSLFSDREEIFVGVVEKAEELSASAAFQYLRRLPRAEKAAEESPNHFMVGRLKGEVYSIDSFDVQSVKQSDGLLKFRVNYFRNESDDGEPAPAMAYFKLKITKTVTHVEIIFNQKRRWSEDNVVPITPPPLTNVSFKITDK